MPVLHYQCPHCTGVFQVDPASAGQQVACPTCQGVVAIGAPSSPPVMAAQKGAEKRTEEEAEKENPQFLASEAPPAGTDGQVFLPFETGTAAAPPMSSDLLGCPHCSGAFQVTAEMAGQQMGCPHCRGVVKIPGGPETAEAQPDSAGQQPDALLAYRFHDSPKKIVVGDRVIEVRRLTPEEKAQRRLIKRVVLIGFCGLILLGAMLYLFYVGLPQQ